MSKTAKFIFIFVLIFWSTGGISAQTKKNQKPLKPASAEVPVPKPTPETVPDSLKSNKRPGTKSPAQNTVSYSPTYFYKFEREGFAYGRILIEHDNAGKGKISFLKDGFDEMLTDPIEISQVTIKKIDDALASLNFLESGEDYQHERDYSHMGNMTLTIKKAGRERTAKYNWTDNKQAKILMDEYRRISNEYTWRFEMNLARENQPLLTPGLMNTIDSYIKRNEISDPAHLLPFLKELSTDERLPLMARNHATTLINQIEKGTRK